jgi:hypothetical protein
LNPLVGDVPIERLLARGGPPEDFLTLMGQQKGQAANEALGLIHEHILALKGFEGGEFPVNTTSGFYQNDRLEAPAHVVLVTPAHVVVVVVVDSRAKGFCRMGC